MSCTCDINVKYGYDITGSNGPFTQYDETIVATGLRNGKSSFSWNDGVLDRILYWDSTFLYWTVAEVILGIEYEIGFTLPNDTDCPGYEIPVEGESFPFPRPAWDKDPKGTYSDFYDQFSAFIICPGEAEQIAIAEQKNCFKLKVWQLQCSFAEKVGTYFNNLSYGIPCSRSLNDLMIMKYGLEILNNYNPDDIHNNTTDYNNITYSEIQNILTQLNT